MIASKENTITLGFQKEFIQNTAEGETPPCWLVNVSHKKSFHPVLQEEPPKDEPGNYGLTYNSAQPQKPET